MATVECNFQAKKCLNCVQFWKLGHKRQEKIEINCDLNWGSLVCFIGMQNKLAFWPFVKRNSFI